MPMNTPWLKPVSKPVGSYLTGYTGLPGTIVTDNLESTSSTTIGILNSMVSLGLPLGSGYGIIVLQGDQVQIHTWGGGIGVAPSFLCKQAEGTVSAPTSVVTSSLIASLRGDGYNGTAFVAGPLRILGEATEQWSQLSNGCKWRFITTPSGSSVAQTDVTIQAGIGLTVNSGTLISNRTIRSELSASPTGTAAGTIGDIRWDNGFVYVCTSTNSWKRAALSAF